MTARRVPHLPAAAVLLLALLPLGGAAQDAGAPPAVRRAQAAPAVPAPTPGSHTIATPGGAPAVATPVIPTAVQGRWTPDSQALAAAGPLSLSAQTLTWSPCGPAARAASARQSGASVLIGLPGQSACRLNGEPVTHLRLQPAPGDACAMELSAYESEAHLARQQRLAWGVYARAGCSGGGSTR